MSFEVFLASSAKYPREVQTSSTTPTGLFFCYFGKQHRLTKKRRYCINYAMAIFFNYDSMSYKDLCAKAVKRDIVFEVATFRGLENNPQLVTARDNLISKMTARDAINLSHLALVVQCVRFIRSCPRLS